eukprot:159808-Hanusia_phi.AAC.3
MRSLAALTRIILSLRSNSATQIGCSARRPHTGLSDDDLKFNGCCKSQSQYARGYLQFLPLSESQRHKVDFKF